MEPDQTESPRPSEGSSSNDDTRYLSSQPGLDVAHYSRTFLGRLLGSYRLTREIGHGSMGIVYEATHVQLDRVVALKVLPPSLSVTETVIRRFRRESDSVARLDHPNIVKIYGVGEHQGIHFYAMQFIEGTPLDRALRERKLSPRECAKITAEAARALFFAHDNGIIHRDVKPANIILSHKDRPVLTDFGLARPEKSGTLTESGALVGTPIYMSPEQVRGDRSFIDRRTDIYSLGVTLYEMLTGQPPFTAESTQEILRKIEFEDPSFARKVRADIPLPLALICHKAIDKEPAYRYQTAIEFALDLERFLGGEPVLARPPSIRRRASRQIRRHPAITWLAALLILSTAITAFVVMSGQRDRQKAENALAAKARAEAASRQTRFNQLMAEGYEFLREYRPSSALSRFQEAVALDADQSTAYVERGKCYYLLEAYDRAMQDFEAALQLESRNPRAKMWRGITRWAVGDHAQRDAGIQDIKETLDEAPDDPECLYEASKLCLNLARDATGFIARDQFINAGFGRIKRTLELLEERNREEHARNLREGGLDDPSLLTRGLDEALVIQGLLYEEMQLPKLAAATYERATKINPSNALAWTLWHSERPAEEEPEDDASENDSAIPASNWFSVLMREGLTWSRESDWDPDIMSKAVEALSLFPAGGQTPANSRGAEPLSIDEVERLLADANQLWNDGDHDQAVMLYREVIEQNQSVAEPFHRLTEYYLSDAKDLILARQHVERAQEISPAHPMTLYLSLRVYSLQRDLDKLTQVWRTVKDYYPGVLTMPNLDLGWFEESKKQDQAGDGDPSPPDRSNGGDAQSVLPLPGGG